MGDRSKILVIDDEETICFAFRRYFESRSHSVRAASTGAAGLAAYAEEPADVVFLDVRLPDGDGLEVLARLCEQDPQARVIVITAYGSLETVTRAIRGRAFDYLVKPIDLDRAAELVAQVQDSRHAAAEGEPPPDAAATPDDLALVGRSHAIQEVYKRIGRVAVNCGALPETLVESELFGYARGAFTGAAAEKPGRFEAADGGTLFFDEIGELPPAAQVKLLRFLDTQTVERLGSVRPIRLDVRILAATNCDLAEAMAAGRFRQDLYYRLAVIQIPLPPLAARAEDIAPLAQHFLALRTPPGQQPPILSGEAAALLEAYPWPGNVRELRNAVEHAAVASGGGPILPAHLPESIRRGTRKPAADGPSALDADIQRFVETLPPNASYREVLEPLEKALIRRALAEAGGNQSVAAERLGLHRNSLRNKLRDLGLDA